MIELLNEYLTFSIEKASKLQFNKSSKVACYAIGIYCSIIELANSYSVLIKNSSQTGTISIYRTLLEHYIDLTNLAKNSKYVNQLDYDSCSQKLKNLKSAQNGNPYLSSIAQYYLDDMPKLEERKRKIKCSGNIKICSSIKQKFIFADMENEYTGLYPTLSGESHCSLEAVFNRHFSFDESGESMKISLFENYNDDVNQFYIVKLGKQLLHSGELVAQILKSDLLFEFKNKQIEFNQRVENHLTNN